MKDTTGISWKNGPFFRYGWDIYREPIGPSGFFRNITGGYDLVVEIGCGYELLAIPKKTDWEILN